MNFTGLNFLIFDFTICDLSVILILCLSIIWTLIISFIFQIILSKIVSLKISKYLSKNRVFTAKFDFCLNSISFNFFLFRFIFKNVYLCIENFCHVEIPVVQIGLNRFNSNQLNSNINRKKYIIYFFDAKFIFFDEILFNQNGCVDIIQNLQFSFNLVYYFQNLTLSLNHIHSEQAANLNLRIKTLTFIFEDDSVANVINYKLINKKSVYKDQNLQFMIKNDTGELTNNRKIILLNFVDFEVGQSSQNGNIFDFFKIKRAKLNMHFGEIPKYNFKNNDNNFEIANLQLFVDIFEMERVELFFDPWNRDLIMFAQDSILLWNNFTNVNRNWIIKLNIKDYKVNLLNKEQKIFKYFSNDDFALIEIANIKDTFLVLKFLLRNVSVVSFLSQDLFFYSSLIYINIKIESKIPVIKISFSNKSSINLSKIAAHFELFDLIWSSYLFKKFNVHFVLIGSMENLIFSLPLDQNCLTMDIKQVGFKFEQLDTLISIVIFENLNIFTNKSWFDLEQNLSAKCERLVCELNSNIYGTKFQFVLSPIQIGPENLFEQIKILNKVDSKSDLSAHSFDSYLYTQMIEENSNEDSYLTNINLNNCLFVTVCQFRYESFANDTELYASFCEVVLGDIFGSLDYENFFKLIDLISSIWIYANKEIELLNFINRIELNYSSLRISTSLINFHVFNNYNNVTSNFHLFNFIISPIDHGSCNFHCENKSKGSLTALTDLSIRIYSSLDVLRKNELIECGMFYFKYMSCLNVEKNDINEKSKESLLEFLIENDKFSKRLDFLWQPSINYCCCVGKSNFFSTIKETMYNFENEFVFKSSVYWLIKNGGSKVGFGQSILEPNESVFYSYRKCFAEYNFYSAKIRMGQKFTVISNLESKEKFIKNKFEPLEINVYDQELNTFMNESVDLKTLNADELSDLNFKSTNMTPPYFSSEFSLYIRYLPKIKSFSNITFKPGEKSSSKGCSSSILYPEDGINTVRSDLNTEFFNKTSIVFKRLRFNWLKSRKKSYKKSLIKKSLNLKEIKNLKFDKTFSSLSSLSLNSLSDNEQFYLNTNQNNNKTNSKRKKSYRDKLLLSTRKKSDFFIYEINLNQILYGFRQNEVNRSGKKLCVEEIYIQTLFLSDQYDYENSYDNFIFEKINTINNQELNESNINVSSKFHSSKAYFLLSKKSIDCVSNLVEFMHKTIKCIVDRSLCVTDSKCSRLLVENCWDKWPLDHRFSLDEIWLQVVTISGDQDFIRASQAFKLKTTTLSIMYNKFEHLKLFNIRQLQIDTFQQSIFPIEQILTNVTELISKIKLSVAKSKIALTNLIINQFKLPDVQIDFNFFSSSLSMQIEIADFKLIEPIAKLSILTDLIQIALMFINAYKNSKLGLFKSLKINYKIGVLIRNVAIKFLLKNSSLSDNSDNYLVYLNGKNFNFLYSNIILGDLNNYLNFENIKVKYSFSLIIELTNEHNSLVLIECDVNKRNLDAILVLKIKHHESDANFVINIIFPLVFESKFKLSFNDFEWTVPGMLIYSACDNIVYQIADVNNIKINLANYEEKFLVNLEKVRLIRSNINLDMFFHIENFLQKIKCDFNFLSTYLFIIKIGTFIFNYFPDGFSSKTWFFLKIFHLDITYTFSIDSSLIEDIVIDFKDSLDSVAMATNMSAHAYQDQLLDIKNSILLLITSKSHVLEHFEVNKWLEFCCLESKNSNGYNVKFIAAFPTLNLDLNFETKESSSNGRKLFNIYSECTVSSSNKEDQNRSFIIVNKKNFSLIEEKIVTKLKNQNLSALNKTQNYLNNRRGRINIRIKEIDGTWINENNFDFFDAQNLSYLIKNCLLENVLIILKILGLLENNK